MVASLFTEVRLGCPACQPHLRFVLEEKARLTELVSSDVGHNSQAIPRRDWGAYHVPRRDISSCGVAKFPRVKNVEKSGEMRPSTPGGQARGFGQRLGVLLAGITSDDVYAAMVHAYHRSHVWQGIYTCTFTDEKKQRTRINALE